jgi:hypothetical protein
MTVYYVASRARFGMQNISFNNLARVGFIDVYKDSVYIDRPCPPSA